MNNKIILFITALCTVIFFNKVILRKRDDDLTGDNKNKGSINGEKKIGTPKKRMGRSGGTNYIKKNADLNKKSRNELYNEAKKLNIKGRSKMSKPDLIKAIKNQK